MNEQGGRWLVKLGIGSVQSFITQSRQVRDLAGSSAIIARVAEAITKKAREYGAIPILPSELNTKEGKGGHQLVLAVDGNSVKETMEGLYASGKTTWVGMLQEGIYHLSNRYEITLLQGKNEIDKQLSDSIEVFCVAVREGGNDAKRAFVEISECFDDRKAHTRNNLPLSTAWRTAPCSLCGQRPSLFTPPEKGWPSDKPFLQGKEVLCAVCAGKRFWAIKENVSYKSTHYYGYHGLTCNAGLSAHVEKTYPERARTMVSDLLKKLSGIETLDPEALAEVVRQLEPEGKKPFLLKELLKTKPYFAVVVLDGDDMGKWTRGDEFGSLRPQVLSPSDADTGPGCTGARHTFLEQLNDISRQVSAFSGGIKNALRDTNAELIYSGGDDALLFVPLDSLFRAIMALKNLWDGTVGSLYDGQGPTVTLHASVIHAKEPLQEALARAFAGLVKAKDNPKKDCFSICFEARSSSDRLFACKWGDDNANVLRFEQAMTLVSGENGHGLSAGLYNTIIAQSALCFEPDTGKLKDADILRRKMDFLYDRSGSSAESKPDWELLREWLLDGAGPASYAKPARGRVFFESVLITAQSLARRDS